MVVPPIKIVQKHQEIASEHPNDNCDGNQALFIDTKSRFDNHFDLMRERETSFFNENAKPEEGTMYHNQSKLYNVMYGLHSISKKMLHEK